MDKVRDGLRSFLRIQQAQNNVINIMETLDFEGNAIKNRIWYRGDSEELSQMYRQISGSKTSFWAATCTKNMEIRKIHVGIPSIVVDVLSDIVVNDMNDIAIDDLKLQDIWNGIEKDNEFNKLLKKACQLALYIGDGSFKISFDSNITKNPILEFVAGDRIDIIRDRGRVVKVVFKTIYTNAGKEYALHETYGRGYIMYQLFFKSKIVPLNTLEETCDLLDITWKGDFMMAIPLQFYESSKYEGRGGSIFDRKIDAFDSLDEAWSQWMDALRANRTREYVPDVLLPRNPYTGEILAPNAFDNRYIQTDTSMGEHQENNIILQQGEIPHESYLCTYITALDLCLQGIISPSTLGIDVKKLDNAESQREKEKTTLYTRDTIVGTLQEVLSALIRCTLMSYGEMYSLSVEENININVTFGEYANPSFESQVETVAKARTGGIMSLEAAVDELYGDSKDEDWKAEEVERLKSEQGITKVEELKIEDDIPV